ncbi:hypothetical protein BGX38DRAFT_1177389 [Terfezia claveryi]|nr:hypothetical protein BGX38DRAFT_1177389 [Terfezia claveryi]
MQHFTFLSLLLSAALILAVPLPLIRRNHQYHESKRVPVLKSGNALITSRYNVVYKQDAPDWHMTEKDKIAQGNDTNRGFCRILPNTKAGGKLQMWGTLNVFVMPGIAEGKDCRFHFFLGSGDGANGYSRLDLHEARYPSRIGEFTTTYNNYPGRRQKLGTFAIYPPKELTDVNPIPDVVANIPDNYNTPAVAEEYTGGYQKIVRKCPVGKVVFDLVPRATESNGILGTVAWSLNKGLGIEIIGVSRDNVPLWNPHDPTNA